MPSNLEIGQGIIDLINRHEPLFYRGNAEATRRVMDTLAHSTAGALAFVLHHHGPHTANAVATYFANIVAAASPEIFAKAMALANKQEE
jgi:hypothetical protein